MIGSHLASAYRATAYVLALPDGECELRIDRPCECLDRWLAANGQACWAWLTAANPGSCRLAPEDNAARQCRLLAEIEALGQRALPGRAVADAGDWPEEPSFLVPGLDAAAALALAARYGQNACLAGDIGQAVRLLWVGQPAA